MLLFLLDFEWFWGGPTWAKVCEGSQKSTFSGFGKRVDLGYHFEYLLGSIVSPNVKFVWKNAFQKLIQKMMFFKSQTTN